MHDLSKLVSQNPELRSIRDLFAGETYLVGGCIRDTLLGHQPKDFDIVTFSDPWRMAQSIGERLASTAFWMDKTRGVVRIALQGSGVTIDLSSPKGEDIREDLLQRDITINAMGLDVVTGEFIDPLCGLDDLEHGIIRVISGENLSDDPLRVLRCLRFSLSLGFAIVESTSVMLKKYAPELRNAAAERVKLEFVNALGSPHGARFFSLMERAHVLDNLPVPALQQHLAHPAARHALRIAGEMDGFIYDAAALLPGIGQTLASEVEAGLSRAAVLRLASFLSGLGATDDRGLPGPGGSWEEQAHQARAFCGALRFSSRTSAMIQRVILCQGHVHEILSHDEPSLLSIHNLCEAASPYLAEVLLLTRARKASEKRDQKAASLDSKVINNLISKIWSYEQETYRVHVRSPLIDGRDVIRILGVSPGPQVGQALGMIAQARAQGLVGTREEALRYLLQIPW